MAQYFDLHVFHSRKDGYSVPVAILDREPEQSFDDDYIIEISVRHNILDAEEANYVDTIDEISEQEYKEMTV
jgi:hypothetical protein